MRERIGSLLLVGGFTLAAFCMGPVARAAEPLTLTSPAYTDNAVMDVKNSGNLKDVPSCVDGANLSPPLAWANPPDGTKSFALTMVDAHGGGGAGFVHLVAYGIPTAVMGFAEGELSKPSDKFVGGKNSKDLATYFGPCPPAGGGYHHYVLILIATDLDPKAPELKPGMTRDELLAALKGHAKGTAGLVLRFQHP
jgi:Raf kinase inhibitor-like YbhB/YbcL family protein